MPGPGGPLCPHRVLSFAFQNLAELSPGPTKASGSAAAAAPEQATAPGSTRGSRILYGELVSSLLLAPLARGAGRGPCLEQRAAALQQPRAGNPQGAAGSAESAPVPARHLRAQELPGAVAPVPWHGQRPGALPCPAHTSSSWDPRQYRGSAGRTERRDFPCHGLSRISPQAPHRTACSDLEPQRALLGLGGTGSPRAGAFSVRACVPRAPATPARAPALPELPWSISGTGEVAAKRNGTVPSLSRAGARPGRSPAPGDSQPGSGGGQRCRRDPEQLPGGA